MVRKRVYLGTLYFLIIIALVSPCSCGKSQQEEAKNQLQELNINFSEKSFVDNAFSGNTKAVELFLKAGMNPNVIITNKNGINLSALSAACFNGHFDTVKYLIKNGADVNPKFQKGYPVLISALVKRVNQETNVKNIVSLLVEKGADVNVKYENESAIDFAQERGFKEIVDILMSARGNKQKNMDEAQYKRAIVGTWQTITPKMTIELTFNKDMSIVFKVIIPGRDTVKSDEKKMSYKFIDKNRIETDGEKIYAIKNISNDELILYAEDTQKESKYKRTSK